MANAIEQLKTTIITNRERFGAYSDLCALGNLAQSFGAQVELARGLLIADISPAIQDFAKQIVELCEKNKIPVDTKIILNAIFEVLKSDFPDLHADAHIQKIIMDALFYEPAVTVELSKKALPTPQIPLQRAPADRVPGIPRRTPTLTGRTMETNFSQEYTSLMAEAIQFIKDKGEKGASRSELTIFATRLGDFGLSFVPSAILAVKLNQFARKMNLNIEIEKIMANKRATGYRIVEKTTEVGPEKKEEVVDRSVAMAPEIQVDSQIPPKEDFGRVISILTHPKLAPLLQRFGMEIAELISYNKQLLSQIPLNQNISNREMLEKRQRTITWILELISAVPYRQDEMLSGIDIDDIRYGIIIAMTTANNDVIKEILTRLMVASPELFAVSQVKKGANIVYEATDKSIDKFVAELDTALGEIPQIISTFVQQRERVTVIEHNAEEVPATSSPFLSTPETATKAPKKEKSNRDELTKDEKTKIVALMIQLTQKITQNPVKLSFPIETLSRLDTISGLTQTFLNTGGFGDKIVERGNLKPAVTSLAELMRIYIVCKDNTIRNKYHRNNGWKKNFEEYIAQKLETL